MGRISKAHVLAGLVVLSAVSCLARPRGFDWPREMLAPLLTPLSHAGTYLGLGIRRNVRDWAGGEMDEATARRLLAENEALRRRMGELGDEDLRKRLVNTELYADELKRQLTGMKHWGRGELYDFPCMIIPATVVGGDPTSFRQARLLRPESKTRPGQLVTTRELLTRRPTAIPAERAVLGGVSLVGQIESSGAWTAHVQLITDADFGMRVLIERRPTDGKVRKIWIDEPRTPGGKPQPVHRQLRRDDPPVQAYLEGRGTDLLITKPLPETHGVAPGDCVVTMVATGGEARLPAGVHIGTVEKVLEVPNKPLYVRLEVRPGADMDTLSDVYVVMPRSMEGP